MIEDKEMEYVNVPTYIEKAVKKLFKLKNTERIGNANKGLYVNS